ncbi:MAG: hypothetical protein WBG71_15245 [Leeuwenhoekiella sp.]
MSCTQDDTLVDDGPDKVDQSISSSFIPFSTIKGDGVAIEAVKNAKVVLNEVRSDRSLDQNGEYSLILDEVLRVDHDSTHSYTFKLTNSKPRHYIENLVLHYDPKTKEYRKYLFQYDISADRFIQMTADPSTFADSKNVTVTRLDKDFLEGQLIHRSVFCQTVSRTVYHNCSQNAHGEWNIDDWDRCKASGKAYAYQATSTQCQAVDDWDDSPGSEEIDNNPPGGGGGGAVTGPVPGIPCDDLLGNIGLVGEAGDCVLVNNDPLPDVDADDQIILDPSVENEPCLRDNLNQLSTSAIASGYFDNFSGQTPVAHLKFIASSFGNNKNASTYPPQNFVIEIKFNTDRTSRPNADIARTIMHEVIHAEIFRKLLSLAGKGSLSNLTEQDIIDAKDNYPGIYDYYTRYIYNNPNPSSPQHDMMAQHMIGTLTNFIMQFDGNLSLSEAEALAWTGLKAGINSDSNSVIDPATGLVVDEVTGLNESTVAWTNLTDA